MNTTHWLLVYAVITAAWLGLGYLVFVANPIPYEFMVGFQVIIDLLFLHPPMVTFSFTLAMWCLMSLAMMLPSFVPTLRVYNDLLVTGAGSLRGFWFLILGYVVIWMGYSLFMSSLQIIFSNQLSVGHHEHSAHQVVPNQLGWWQPTLLLGLAGAYQFTKFKDNCLKYCRNPLLIFLARGNVSPIGDLITGIKLGFLCLGCCFFLMMLCIIGGVMNFFWMGLLTLIITLEKLPNIGKVVSKPLGLFLLVSSFGAGLQYCN